MIEPKIFYRKLDSIQNKIGKDKSRQEYLFDLTDELEKVFGDDLRIGKGIIYEKNDDEFILISKPDQSQISIASNIIATDPAIEVLEENKIYIYDSPSLVFPGWRRDQSDYKIPVALRVSSLENSWIFVFELKSNWQREEIEFCLNAVRSALKFRLISDSLNNEMQQAVHIQKSLLPQKDPKVNGYDIAGRSNPAELVGGDIYDYVVFDDDTFGFCIGDASGHGLPAALLARDAVTGLRMGLEKHMKMVHTLKKLNHVIYQSVFSTKFISMFYGELEDDGNLFYVNAGHPSPILVNGDQVIELDSTGVIFGALPEIELHRSFVRLEKGSVLVLFTDGIFERENKERKDYGLERLTKIIIKNQNLSAIDIRDSIFSDADLFGGNKKWDDDVTIVVIKRLLDQQKLD